MSEQSFDPQKVAIAAITYYPKWYRGKLRSIKHTDKVRGDLALEFAQIVSKLGYHLVISDGTSAKTFRKELALIPGIHVIRRRQNGSGDAKRSAMDKAAAIPGVEVIVLNEPEKLSIVTNCLQQIVGPILQDHADIVVPKREDSLFKATYPRYMYDSEVEANRIYNEALRSNNLLPATLYDMDSFFGPRAFRNNKTLIELFKRKYHFTGMSILEKLYSPDTYSNVQFFPIVNALKKKIRVISVVVPFSYPRLQKENEDIGARDIFIEKRSLQRMSILIDLMHFLSFLQSKKKSAVRVLK